MEATWYRRCNWIAILFAGLSGLPGDKVQLSCITAAALVKAASMPIQTETKEADGTNGDKPPGREPKAKRPAGGPKASVARRRGRSSSAKSATKGPTKSAALNFAIALLRKKPRLSFSEVETAGRARGHKLIPIQYGRAKLHLGIARRSKRPRGRPGRPPSLNRQANGEPLTGLISSVADLAQREVAFSQALKKIRSILDTLPLR